MLCGENGVGRSTITDVKKREPAVKPHKHKTTKMGRSAKVMKLGRDEEFEAALFLWFRKKLEAGVPNTGPIVQAKAWELHQQLYNAYGDIRSTQEFTASLARISLCIDFNITSVSGPNSLN